MSKAKKTRGVAIVATSAKRTRKAGKKKQVPANSGPGQHLRAEETVHTWEGVSEKLDTLMRSMVDLSSQMKDLSGRVEATEDCQRVVVVFPASLNTSRQWLGT